MLTVKHIDPATNSEKIHAACSVEYKPRHRSECQTATEVMWSAATVFIENAKGEKTPLGNWGKFYVMNDIGKTVATYDLGGDEMTQAPKEAGGFMTTLTGGTNFQNCGSSLHGKTLG